MSLRRRSRALSSLVGRSSSASVHAQPRRGESHPKANHTAEDFKKLVSTNLDGFIHMTQLAIKQMLAQKSGGSIVSITAALADNPIAGVSAAIQ
jgi:NAD(P)-dependent dehydrogenase (short-subunit alcohol dehydrogenase family)